MPKIPRDIGGKILVKLLKKFGYIPVGQTDNHIRLLSNYQGTEHKLTIPAHSHIKIKTLNNILNDVSQYLQITKEELVKAIFTNTSKKCAKKTIFFAIGVGFKRSRPLLGWGRRPLFE